MKYLRNRLVFLVLEEVQRGAKLAAQRINQWFEVLLDLGSMPTLMFSASR